MKAVSRQFVRRDVAADVACCGRLADQVANHRAQLALGMPVGMRHDQPNSISLEPGETKELTWRFAGAGTLEYACHEPGHYEGGMHGRLVVG